MVTCTLQLRIACQEHPNGLPTKAGHSDCMVWCGRAVTKTCKLPAVPRKGEIISDAQRWPEDTVQEVKYSTLDGTVFVVVRGTARDHKHLEKRRQEMLSLGWQDDEF